MSAGSRFGTDKSSGLLNRQTDEGTQETNSLQQDLLKETRCHFVPASSSMSMKNNGSGMPSRSRTESAVSLALFFLRVSSAQIWGNDGFEADASAPSKMCPTLFADFKRRQLASFDSDVFLYNEMVGGKHVPYLTFSESTLAPNILMATIVVGDGDKEGGVYHPMVASDKVDEVHFVTHIMVKDQNGNVVALKSMDATGPIPASMTFEVPAGTTELTPYEWW